MQLSIIIPTHNRASGLRDLLFNIESLKGEVEFEVIVVDNNSTDNTKEVVLNSTSFAKYVFEGNTAFSKARKTGFENSSGEVLLYIDDDIEIFPSSLKAIVSIFDSHPECGVIAGQIIPKFPEEPPSWCLACQATFNGWSLYYPGQDKVLHYGFQEVSWAAGPMMAISRKAYEESGGFPPDTIGVETNTSGKTFRKLYIGPGDYGLCHNIIKGGRKVYYSPEVKCAHIISPTRFTTEFWRSRMIGEGHHGAITDRMFFNYSVTQLRAKRLKLQQNIRYALKELKQKQELFSSYGKNFEKELHYSELSLNYTKAYLEMDFVLHKFPNLATSLWEAGANGISNNRFDDFVQSLPPEFLAITSPENVYIKRNILNIEAYKNMEGLCRMSASDRLYKFSLESKSAYRSFKNVMRVILKPGV